MKKIIITILFGILAISSLIGCERKEDNKSNVQLLAIPQEQVENIEQLFEIDIPNEGEVLYYDSSLKNDELGYIYTEMVLSEEHYDSVMSQIKDAYVLETLEVSYLEADKFKTTKEEIDMIYVGMDGFRRTVDSEKMEKIPLTIYYRIYTTKVEDGTFRIMFSANPC